uniref:Uncharacterized protein n=1 Tax=Parascaris univalens TaxID=6257 RepID=A0A914ZIU5_PARUN
MLPAAKEEAVDGSRISAAFESVSETTRANIRRNGSDVSDTSITTNDLSKSKQKHVVRIVTRRAVPSRSSLSASESGQGMPEPPHMAFTKDTRAANPSPYLEPAEMLESDVANDYAASTSVAGAAMDDKVVAVESSSERHILAHQLGDSVWPLLSHEAVDFSYAANVIVGMCQVPAEQICHTQPQKYTNTGTFVVDLRGFANRHEVALDGLGAWGKPQGSSRYYKFVGAIPVKVQGVDGSEVKVLCNRYEHPGTMSERGRFIRKIMTGVSTSSGTPLPLAVVVYEWLGEPHPIQLRNMDAVEASRRPYGSRSWEARNVDVSQDEGLQFDGQPLYAKVAVDFDTVARIILGAEVLQPTRLCTRVPQKYRAQGTFVIDISKLESESALRKDGNGSWGRPSGCSRYYKLTAHNDVIRIERGLSLPACGGDIQILSKRYENETSIRGSFVRKIYTGKRNESRDTSRLCPVAVITYFWKGSIVPLVADEHLLPQLRPNKRPHEGVEEDGNKDEGGVQLRKSRNHCPETKCSVVNDIPSVATNESDVGGARVKGAARVSVRASNIWDDETPSLDNLVLNHADHLKRLALAKELENQNRFAALLDRAEQFLDRFEQVVRPCSCSTLRILLHNAVGGRKK